ncbi:MAG: peptidoglycan bridge formation glycyltransferase FemA/FemB family protein, partial [Spirochaetaceae bacterium]|nr:peptidoglycan bridge formation glycyltransferase FemA/FemB family protein [Spirochaetaceae bacterium]
MGGNFLQSEFWGKFKEKFGWKVFNSHEPHEKHEQSLQILYRRLPFHIGMAYIPWGEIEPDDIVRVLNEIRGFLPKDTTFVRYDPPELKETYSLLLSTSYFLKKAPADVQPPDTVILDLRPSEEDILKQMKPKGRYNIRLAGRHGVQVRDADPTELPVFYSLFTETCKRDGIAQHTQQYYQPLIDIFTPEIRSSPSHISPPLAGG